MVKVLAVISCWFFVSVGLGQDVLFYAGEGNNYIYDVQEGEYHTENYRGGRTWFYGLSIQRIPIYKNRLHVGAKVFFQDYYSGLRVSTQNDWRVMSLNAHVEQQSFGAVLYPLQVTLFKDWVIMGAGIEYSSVQVESVEGYLTRRNIWEVGYRLDLEGDEEAYTINHRWATNGFVAGRIALGKWVIQPACAFSYGMNTQFTISKPFADVKNNLLRYSLSVGRSF